MKKKTIAAAVMASCMALTATFAGCSLVSSDNKKDMAQEIATVDITKSKKFGESGLSDYKDAVSGETSIYKKDLVSYFLNVGYSLVQNGKSYEETFNMLMDALVENAVLVQYSTMALLEIKAESNSGALGEFTALKTLREKYEYLLDDEDKNLARYKLYSSVNKAIDNSEKTVIEDEDEYKGTATRTTPVNLETEQDDYYPENEDGSLNYNIYTGFEGEGFNNLLSNSGAYEEDALEGTTRATRIKAYNAFLKNLKDNDLITEEDEKGNLKNINSLSYLEEEYVTQLESCIIDKYFDIYEEQQGEKLLNNNYIQNRYEELLADQKDSYKTGSAFETAMGSMASNSFLLYSPETSEDNELEGTINDYSNVDYGRFGFVYNILLPFNAKQTSELNGLKSILSQDGNDNYYYNERNKLLEKIETEDQRSAWFNGATDYSFKASEAGITDYYHSAGSDSGYLFFEGNLTDSGEGNRYKKLQAYDGRYSYNGKVFENEDGSYTLLGEKLTIDGMLDEFTAYINYVLGGDNVEITKTANYYGAGDDRYNLNFYKDEEEEEIDYTKFLYAYGKVDLGVFDSRDLFYADNTSSNQYKAMSAVNELQFAYTTDTSVLSQYAGYTVSAYETNYVKEFEYAAKLAISNGAGAFTVCAGDYGWHLIYVTSVFDNNSTNDGETYKLPNWDRVDEEGTFENLFFEWIKGNDIKDVNTTRRSKIINDFKKENESVVKYQKRYQDLLDLKNEE